MATEEKTITPKTEKLKSKSVLEPKPKKNGGARPGAGRPKGKKAPHTIEREEAQKQFKDRVAKVTERLFNSQMSLAEGISLLFRVDKDSKGHDLPAVQVTDPEEIKAFIDGDTDGGYYFITTKQPDNKAIDSMLDRTYGKAKIPIEADLKGKPPIALVTFAPIEEEAEDESEQSDTSS